MAVTRFTGSQTDSGPSAVDLRGKELFLARKNAAGAIVLSALGERVNGVISEGKNVGLWSSMQTGNQLKAVASAAIAVGDKLSSDANGKVRVAAAGHHVFGMAKRAADAGEIVEFYMDQEGPAA